MVDRGGVPNYTTPDHMNIQGGPKNGATDS